VAAVLVAVAALLPATASPARSGALSSLAALQTGVLAQLNRIREEHGLQPLKLDSALSAAAREHTDEMLSDGYFAHESADGQAFWKRIERYYPSSQFGYWSVGENLLWVPGSLDADAALKLWMASPEHRANILLPSWRQIGIAAEFDSGAPGVYGGSSVTVVATDFGVRR